MTIVNLNFWRFHFNYINQIAMKIRTHVGIIVFLALWNALGILVVHCTCSAALRKQKAADEQVCEVGDHQNPGRLPWISFV